MANTKQSPRRSEPAAGKHAAEMRAVSRAGGRGRRRRRGPSPQLVAWRGFVMESLLCLVLIAVIAIVAVRDLGGVLVGPLVATVAATIVQIVRRDR